MGPVVDGGHERVSLVSVAYPLDHAVFVELYRPVHVGEFKVTTELDVDRPMASTTSNARELEEVAFAE